MQKLFAEAQPRFSENPREKQFFSAVIVSRPAKPAGEEKPDPGRLSSRLWEEAGLATQDPVCSWRLRVSRRSPASGQRPGRCQAQEEAPMGPGPM